MRLVEGFEYACEVVDAKFDNAMELMLEKSFIYGGAIRDILSKFEIGGDLDIVCNVSDFRTQCAAFSRNPRWQRTRGSVSEARETKSEYGIKSEDAMKTSKSSDTILRDIAVFNNMDGETVQIMSTNNQLALVKEVDLACCGVILLKSGEVYEVVQNAVKDCINRVLDLNPDCSTITKSRTEKRISKLEKRGWKNNISPDQLERAESSPKRPASKRCCPSELFPPLRSEVVESGHIAESYSKVIEELIAPPVEPVSEKQKLTPAGETDGPEDSRRHSDYKELFKHPTLNTGTFIRSKSGKRLSSYAESQRTLRSSSSKSTTIQFYSDYINRKAFEARIAPEEAGKASSSYLAKKLEAEESIRSQAKEVYEKMYARHRGSIPDTPKKIIKPEARIGASSENSVKSYTTGTFFDGF